MKIRGYRVELGEIETRLMNHEQVKDAVVTVIHGDGGKVVESARGGDSSDKSLCAYIALSEGVEGGLTVSQLRDYLSGELPDYMIPGKFILLEQSYC